MSSTLRSDKPFVLGGDWWWLQGHLWGSGGGCSAVQPSSSSLANASHTEASQKPPDSSFIRWPCCGPVVKFDPETCVESESNSAE